jgi:hyperosmotically inducible protein
MGAAANIARAAPNADPAPTLDTPASHDNQPQPHSDSLGDAISDTAITTKVKLGFSNEARLHGADIGVKTTNGVVTLSGTAANHDTAAAAEQIAQSVDGVKEVDNQIHTPSVADKLATGTDRMIDNTKAAVSDTSVTSKVKAELLTSKSMKGSSISVTTTNGVVALAGQVQSGEQKDAAEQLTRQIHGVKSVDASRIIVASAMRP